MFEPADDGMFEATLTIHSDDPDNGELEIAITGAAHRGVIFDTPEDAIGVTIVEDIAYMASTGYLYVIDVSDPEHPSEVTAYTQDGLSVMDMTIVDTCVFLAAAEEGIIILNITDMDNISILGSYDTPGYTWSVAVNGDYAYVADGESGLRVIDLYDMERLLEVNYVDTPVEARGITIDGNFVYIADHVHGLRIIDISDPQEPFETGYYNTRGLSFDVSVSADYAYVADERYGFRVIEVSEPAEADEIGFYDTAENAYGVDMVGGHAYVADGWGGMYMLDISEPESPNPAKVFYTPGLAWDVVISGDHAFIAGGESGLQVVDITEFLSADDHTDHSIPDDFALLPAYPNPFNETITISFSLPLQGKISHGDTDIH